MDPLTLSFVLNYHRIKLYKSEFLSFDFCCLQLLSTFILFKSWKCKFLLPLKQMRMMSKVIFVML